MSDQNRFCSDTMSYHIFSLFQALPQSTQFTEPIACMASLLYLRTYFSVLDYAWLQLPSVLSSMQVHYVSLLCLPLLLCLLGMAVYSGLVCYAQLRTYKIMCTQSALCAYLYFKPSLPILYLVYIIPSCYCYLQWARYGEFKGELTWKMTFIFYLIDMFIWSYYAQNNTLNKHIILYLLAIKLRRCKTLLPVMRRHTS